MTLRELVVFSFAESLYGAYDQVFATRVGVTLVQRRGAGGELFSSRSDD